MNPSIKSLSYPELEQSSLHEIFKQGTSAVQIQDKRALKLWNALLEKNDYPEGQRNWYQFWNDGLFTYAKNHIPNKTDFGDHYRFEQENFGHIARKVVIQPYEKTGKFICFPKKFYADNKSSNELPQEIMKTCWEIAADYFKSLTELDEFKEQDYVVSIEALKYPDSLHDFNKTLSLLNHGPQGKRRGIKLDLARSRARGFFRKPFLIDLFAWGVHLPIISDFLYRINNLFKKNIDTVPDDLQLLGEPHIDGFRTLTIILSDRDIMVTEAYNGQDWNEIPMSKNSFSIFPADAASEHYKIQATTHRYSIKKQEPKDQKRKDNISLVLGVSPKKMFLQRTQGILSKEFYS